jgi:hypothetical protein
MVSTAIANAQPLDVRGNLIYPTNPPRDAVERENPELTQKVIDALKTQSVSSSKDPRSRFLEAYRMTQQGLSFIQNANPDKAREMYLSATETLKGLTREYPDWQPSVVKYRLDYLQRQLNALQNE